MQAYWGDGPGDVGLWGGRRWIGISAPVRPRGNGISALLQQLTTSDYVRCILYQEQRLVSREFLKSG